MAAPVSADRLWRWLAGVLLAVGMAGACAHPMPESRIWVDTQPGGLRLTLQIPLNRLEYAFGQPLADEADQVLQRHGDALAAYLLRHVGARSGNAGWQALRPRLAVQGHDASAELEAVMELRAPPGADPRRTTLLVDAVTHEVRTHRVQVLLRSDWEGGHVGEAPRPLGELDAAHNTLALDLGTGRAAAGFVHLLGAGAMHILEGADHLLFLLLLVAVAPLAAGGAWRHVAWVVSAFTLGHTLTLALGSTGLVQPPAQAVEVAVALTIAAAALHAWRPRFTRAEAPLALAFGLVHGFAFSASLSGAGLGVGQHAAALLAFNLGIEAVQVLLVALVLPALLRIARHRPAAFARLRKATAAVAAVLAALWLAERLGATLPQAWSGLDGGGRWLALLPLLLWLAAAWAKRGVSAPR